MHARWLCLTSFSILLACGGESTSHAGKGAGGSGAQAGSGGNATGGSSGNGASGAVGGGSGGVGGSPGGAPAGGASPCQPIIDSYAVETKSAKACNPFIDDLNECTGTVPNSIVCSCAPTYVNPANTEAIENLNHIQEEAFARHCLPLSCPAIACEQPVFGTCVLDPSSNSGICQDLFASGAPGGN